MFRHPKYYKELRKRNKEEARAQLKVPSSNLDQAISYDDSTESQGVRPGPGHKLQAREDSTANSTRGQVAEPQASSAKLEAASDKQQAPGNKLK